MMHQAQTIEARLSFLWEELRYDIANYAYIEGQLMADEAENARHITMDVAECGNVDRLRRTLALAHATVQHMLYPYTKTPVERERSEADDMPTEPTSYDLVLRLPKGVAQGTLDLLRHYIHEYLVCRALADWVEITLPERAIVWQTKLEEAKAHIDRFKNFRLGRVRRPLRPF